MSANYHCPACKSSRVRIRYPDIECLSCGFSESLFDYPISWDFHRTLSLDSGQPDPGTCYAPEEAQSLTELQQRIDRLESIATSLSPEELRQQKLKHIWDEVQDLRRALHFTQKHIAEVIRSRTPAFRKKPFTGGIDV